METKANYALIGAFVLLAFIAVIGFVAWLSGSQFDEEIEEYDVVFTGAVRGLTVGGEVRYNGLRVGEVKRLSLDPGNSNIVRATVEVDANTPVRTNSYAQLEPQGLTGLSYIQIFAGSEEFGLLRDLRKMSRNELVEQFGDEMSEDEIDELLNSRFDIPGEMSAIDNIIDGGGDVVDQARNALVRANALLSDEAVSDFQGILSNLNTLSGRLAEAEVDPKSIQTLIDDASAAARQLRVTLRTYDEVGKDVQRVINEDIEALIARVETTVSNVDGAIAGFGELADDGQLLVVDLREAINRLSTSGLTDLEETTESLRQLVGSLNRISSQIERSPLAFIVGDERQVVEIPQ